MNLETNKREVSLSKRSSGVLMHISSLPGNYGIGSLGKEAKNFIDLLEKMGMSYWQILPIGPTDLCFSPYKSTSAFAGNPLFIDLDGIFELGLLTKEELHKFQSTDPKYTVNFKNLVLNRDRAFSLAFERISPKLKKEIDLFTLENKKWLPDFALYTTLCTVFSEMDWRLWPESDLSLRKEAALKAATKKYKETIDFHCFLQYVFYLQWSKIKSYANEKGIGIIGDIPIYVAMESADVWSHPELFQLDDEANLSAVSGVPPDYFSQDGQLWGNPLYNWDQMKKNDYSWWMDRIKAALSSFDLVRIDHFRGFSKYWSIPANETTAKNGRWVDGPGMDFFNVLFKCFPTPGIIAEDLGVQDEALSELLADTNFPGMRVMEFGFIEKGNNNHLPHNYPKNMVAYTGTHDNNTLLGTLFSYSDQERDYVFNYCGYKEHFKNQWCVGGPQSPSCRAFIRTLFQSCAQLVILPIQDICGYGEDTKMNQPGTSQGNWTFRMTKDGLNSVDIAWIYHLNQLFHRIYKK